MGAVIEAVVIVMAVVPVEVVVALVAVALVAEAVVAVEAGASLGWERYAHKGVALDRFGASAPYPEVYERLGFTPERVAEAFLARG